MGVPLSANKPACCQRLKVYKTVAMTPDDSGDDAFIIRDPSGLTGGLSPRHSLDKRGQEIELIRCYRNAIYARPIWFGRAEDPISRWTRVYLFRIIRIVDSSVDQLANHRFQLIDLWNLATRWDVNRQDTTGEKGEGGTMNRWSRGFPNISRSLVYRLMHGMELWKCTTSFENYLKKNE